MGDLKTFKNSFEIRFHKDHKSEILKNSKGLKIEKNGLWTMVYDEGIEFGMGKKDTSSYSNFFMFMKYSLNDGKTLPDVETKHYSHCYETLIGWYYTQKNKWGCIWGHKKVKNWNKPTNGEVEDKKIVLE